MAEAPFKRINFFKGFLTTEKDWNNAERYHVEKRKLHNRAFHAPGVVPGYGDELRVMSRGRGDLSIEIGSGYAIDGQGHDIIVSEKQIRTLSPGDFKLPATIYIVLRYVEEFDDFIVYRENIDYQGHRSIKELAKVEFSIVEPDINTEVELGRVFLEKGARRVTDARDPMTPQPNELDLRFVRRAGVAGMKLSPMILHRLEEAIRIEKRILAFLARVKKIMAAQDAFHAVISLEMIIKTAYVDHANVWDLLRIIAELKWDVVYEVEGRVPDLSAKKEFAGFKKNVDILRGLVAERRRTDEGLENIITYQMKSCESLDGLLDRIRENEIKVRALEGPTGGLEGGGEGGGAGKASYSFEHYLPGGIAYEEIKVRSEPFTQTIVVDGKEWVLVDELDILDPESEEKHDFVIREARDTYRTRQKLRYPDGTIIEDRGIAHEGGFCEFKVSNVTPHQDLVLIRRMDYVHGEYQAEIHVDGQRIDRILNCDGEDRKYRWRNWPYIIPAQYINSPTLHIKQVMLTADRDINMFRYWFYQPK
ncbi:MAG: hypothetical protein R3F65_12000 [bacterium]|nr:hypothetical protein [Myxococcales bacterium]MCB9541210.1 hypothetical protein [Myxococcales bacterium]MCB9551228.1 hypothetical protein [Myxococcales bacterium]